MLQCPNGLYHIILDVLTAPWRENYIFGFLGSGTQIEGGQNMALTATPSLSDTSSAMIGVK